MSIRIFTIYSGFICSLAIFIFPCFAQSTPEPELLLPGSFHGDELTGKTGETWVALIETEKGFELRNVTVSVEATHDPLNDEKESDKSGKIVSVAGTKDQKAPLFLLRNLPGTKLGPVKMVKKEKIDLYPGKSLGFPAGNAYLYLLVTGLAKKSSSGEIGFKDYQVSTQLGDKNTLLFEHKAPDLDGGVPSLLWSGDINGDGIPDFLMSTSGKYSAMEWTLFYSDKNEQSFKKISFSSYSC